MPTFALLTEIAYRLGRVSALLDRLDPPLGGSVALADVYTIGDIREREAA